MDFNRPYLEHVAGDTWCIVTDYIRLPLYKLDHHRAIMIDSGLHSPYGKPVFELLDKENICVEAILTSHTHIDHTGNHNAFKERYGTKLYMTPFDAAAVSNPVNLKFFLQGSTYRGIQDYAKSMFCRADYIINPEEEHIELFGNKLKILQLPGHAPEQIGFVTPDGVAYLADALLSEEVFRSIRIPLCACCELDFITKRNIGEMSYPYYFLAHNEITSDVKELVKKNIANLQEKIDIVASTMENPITLDRITAIAATKMGVVLDTTYKVIVSKSNINFFVEYLQDQGIIEQIVEDGMLKYIRIRK